MQPGDCRRGLGLVGAVLLAMLSGIAAAPVEAQPALKLVIDTDVGDDIDDAYALAWALSSPKLQVLGVTTAWGDTRLRDRMVRRLLATMQRPDVAVGHGLETPSTTPFTQSAWAAGGADSPVPPDAVALTLDLIRRHPHEITLVALAPLTNVAAMIDRDPATFAKVRQVVLMGGSIERGYGNAGPAAEYNAAQAPGALAKLLASGVAVVMFPLDATQVRLDAATTARLVAAARPTTIMLATLTGQWRRGNAWGQTVPTLFDAVPIAWLVDPALCPTRPMRLAVDAKGMTRAVAGKPNVAVCLASDAAGVVAHMARDLLAQG